MRTTHLADRINVEAKTVLLGFPLDLALEQLAAQLRLRVERLRFEIALQGGELPLPNRQVSRGFFIGHIFQLIVMRSDPVK